MAMAREKHKPNTTYISPETDQICCKDQGIASLEKRELSFNSKEKRKLIKVTSIITNLTMTEEKGLDGGQKNLAKKERTVTNIYPIMCYNNFKIFFLLNHKTILITIR